MAWFSGSTGRTPGWMCPWPRGVAAAVSPVVAVGVNIARPFGGSKQVLRVSNDSGAVAGESVSVVIDDGVPLAAALRVYAAPVVVGVLGGAALGTVLAPAAAVDLYAGIGALLGGGLAVLLVRSRQLPWSRSRDLPVRLERGGSVSSGGCGR